MCASSFSPRKAINSRAEKLEIERMTDIEAQKKREGLSISSTPLSNFYM